MFDGYYAINLEVNKNLIDLPSVKTSDYKSRGLDITRTLNGVVQNTAGQVIMLNAKTPDGRSICALADVEDTNVGHYLLTYPNAMMNVAGEVQIELTIVDTTGTISTNTGTVNVIEAVANYGDVEDAPQYPAFVQALQQLQTMQTQINTMQTQVTGIEKFETGCMVMSPVALDSNYWVPLDGSSTSNYPTLAKLFGNNLPNMNGKVPVALDSTQAEFNTLGEIGGEKTHTLTVAEAPIHNHGIKMYASSAETADHYSAIKQGYSGYGGFADRLMISSILGNSFTDHIETTGGGGAHNNLQPYCVLGQWYVHI